MRRARRSRIVFAVLGLAVVCSSTIGRAQPQVNQALSSNAVARLPVDPVDFSGIWYTYQPEGFAFQPAPDLLPAAAKLLQEHRERAAKGITLPTASGRCIPPGIPSLLVRVYPMQIVRTPKALIVIHEYQSQVRFLYTDGRPHPAKEDILPSFNGHSVAHWEGKTLVIDSIGFKTEVAGLPTQPMGGVSIGPDFHIVERWSLSEDGTMLTDELTMTDPTLFAKPWKTMKRFKRRDDMELMEYTCLPEENPIEIDESGKEVFKKPGN